MVEQERLLENYIMHFGDGKRSKNDMFKDYEDVNNLTLKGFLRNPPFLEDAQPFIDTYISKVRELQAIVKNEVDFSFRLTETDGAEYDHLFNTDFRSLNREIENWGKSVTGGDMIRYMNTGHYWVTVRSARFRTEEGRIDDIKRINTQIVGLYKPIGAFNSYAREYQYLMMGIFPMNREHHSAEYDRVNKLNEIIKADTFLINKNILSTSFTSALVCALEKPAEEDRM